MSGDMVSVKVEDNIAYYTFKGGKELNLMDLHLALEMRQALETLEKDPEVKVVVIQGHGEKAFSAGVDVRKMKDFTPSTGEHFIRNLHAMMRKTMTLKQPDEQGGSWNWIKEGFERARSETRQEEFRRPSRFRKSWRLPLRPNRR